MARNVVQFQKGLSEPAFEQEYGTEEQCRAIVIASRCDWLSGCSLRLPRLGRASWRKVETDLIDYAKQIEKLWNAAWDQRNAETIASEAEHAAALAAVRAEKAAPGSAETMGRPTLCGPRSAASRR
jgi:hypothetical protein